MVLTNISTFRKLRYGKVEPNPLLGKVEQKKHF